MIRKQDYPEIKKKLWAGALRSPSYFAGSCGVRLSPLFGNTSNNKERQNSYLLIEPLTSPP